MPSIKIFIFELNRVLSESNHSVVCPVCSVFLLVNHSILICQSEISNFLFLLYNVFFFLLSFLFFVYIWSNAFKISGPVWGLRAALLRVRHSRPHRRRDESRRLSKGKSFGPMWLILLTVYGPDTAVLILLRVECYVNQNILTESVGLSKLFRTLPIHYVQLFYVKCYIVDKKRLTVLSIEFPLSQHSIYIHLGNAHLHPYLNWPHGARLFKTKLLG